MAALYNSWKFTGVVSAIVLFVVIYFLINSKPVDTKSTGLNPTNKLEKAHQQGTSFIEITAIPSNMKLKKNPKESTVLSNPLKLFVYLTQTESCLYDYLSSPQQLGDPSSCRCDVIVLSFKKRCNNSSLPHVEYIFNPNTTWTTGRNVLYRTVMKREQRSYLYYTFLDDDISVSFLDDPPSANLNPWREYERSLLQLQPAVGVLRGNHKARFGEYFNGKCTYPNINEIEFLPFRWFDAMFNSFHSEVIDYLLPYYDKMESVSIWFSQVYLIMKIDVMFPGQVFHNMKLEIANPLHRPYARKVHNSNTVRKFLGDLKSEIPTKYHKQLEPKFQDWVKNVGTKEMENFHCETFSPEVKRPFVPYGYLDTVNSVTTS